MEAERIEAAYSKNPRAEQVMGRRLSKEDEARGVIPFDLPCELGYWCPKCRIEWDEQLAWSEYASFLWCERCDFDYPSALCVPLDAAPNPERPYVNAGRDAAVRIFLDSVEGRLARTAALLAECEEALEWYGEHDQTCGFGQMREDAAGCSIPPLCDCGFEAILSKIRSAKEKA